MEKYFRAFFSTGLVQVMATEENREPPSEQPPAGRNDGLSGQIADHLSGVAFKLALSEDEHKVSVVCPSACISDVNTLRAKVKDVLDL